MKHKFAIVAQNIARIMSEVVSLHHIVINTKNRQMTITSEHCELKRITERNGIKWGEYMLT